MSTIIILTLVAAFALGVFRILSKLVGTSVSPILGAIFIYLRALIVTSLAFLVTRPEIVINDSLKKGLGIASFGRNCHCRI